MSSKRYSALDAIRGVALLNMILYHAVWDLVYIFDCNWRWYHSPAAGIWQQIICCTFIFLSGFCQPLGKKTIQRGVVVFLFGAVISAVTIVIMPENRVIFGVLTLLGSCMLLIKLLEPLMKRYNPLLGFITSILLFIFTKNINQGYLGFGAFRMLEPPGSWYSNWATAYLGFPMRGFYSTDYFSLFPWIFLFAAGYFLYGLWSRQKLLSHLEPSKIKSLEWVGKRSLGIYMIHQPVLYAAFLLFFSSGG